ncbi:MarR family winged helix-turn-helix transcriptional regulator [Streptomyces sp. PA03-3a]|nr:MarR family winged helix-turn-helix transcriptional regulator [Streptomyces sp. PA03-3a]
MTSQRRTSAEGPESGLDMEDNFGFALGVVFRAYAKVVEAAVAEIPGGPRGYFTLMAAIQGHANSQRALAKRLGIDRTIMTYLLDDLERADLVERKPDPSDRRSRHIVATEHGRQRWEELSGPVGLAEQQLLDVLPEESRATFRALLRTLAHHVSPDDPMVQPSRAIASQKPDRPPAGRTGRRSTT